MVFCSDSRTSAGPDMLSSYSKMHVFTPAPDRLIVLLTAGNLATTQAIVSRVESEQDKPGIVNLGNCSDMAGVARYIGGIVQDEHARAQSAATAGGVDTSTSLLLGGQIQGGGMANYLVYPAGNYITDSDQNPFLQIGESKYGKPMLDRVLSTQTSLADGARLALVSLDATMRSNVTVGPPFDLAICPRDTFTLARHERIHVDSDFYRDFRAAWQDGLQAAFRGLPPFDWER
jgi:putative proteasome-type protease